MDALRCTVAVTGLNATDNPGPGVAVARALRADPAFQGRIVGLAYDALDPGLYTQGLFDAAYLVPYPSFGRDALFERLAWIQEREAIDVLLPNLDSELPALLDHQDRLEALGIRSLLPSREAFDRRTKARLHELDGIPVPPSEVLTDPNALYTIGERLGYPVVVKGPFYGAEVCNNAHEAVQAFHRAAARWGFPIIAQKWVPGEEVNVVAVGDGQGGLVGAVAMRKLLLTDKGKGWAGVAIHDPALMKLTEDVVRALGWRGPCEVEARRDRDGQLHLMEVNPRLPAWCDLCIGAGQPLISAVARIALGEEVQPFTRYRAGAAFVRISIDQMVDISQLEAIATKGYLGPAELRAVPEEVA